MPRPIPNIINAFQEQGWLLAERTVDAAIAVLERRAALLEDAGAIEKALASKEDRPSAHRTGPRLAAGPELSGLRSAGADVTVVTDPEATPDESGPAGNELYTLVSRSRNGPALAVVPVAGFLAKYSSIINGVSLPDGMTYDRAARGLLAAAVDPRVAGGRGAVLLNFDSPGGTTAGTNVLNSAIGRVRAAGVPVHAYAGDMAASAAYWAACCCESIIGPPTALVGSVGTYLVLTDTSGMKPNGMRKILVASGSAKGAGADGAITSDQLKYIHRQVMAITEAFATDVQVNRGIDDERMSEVVTGAAFIGADAVKLGLMDGIASFADVVGQLVSELAA